MATKVITAPSQQIPTADLRAHCRITGTDEDALLVGFLAGAVDLAEHYTQRAIGVQTLELALDEFPDGAIAIERGPVVSITSVKYINEAGTEQTLSTSLYTLDDYSQTSWVIPAYDTEWPDTRDVANAVKVRYQAGSLPAAVKSALLLTTAHLWENRESTSPTEVYELPMGAKALLDTVKVWSF